MSSAGIQSVALPRKVERLIGIGTQFERHMFGQGLRLVKGTSFEFLFVETNLQGGGQKGIRNATAELRELMAPGKLTLVFSDIGERGRVKFEDLSVMAKRIDPGCGFALLTNKPECIGDVRTFLNFIRDRGTPPESLPRVTSSVDYVLGFSSGDMNVLGTMVNLHEHRLNFERNEERVILVVEDKPSYYTEFLMSLYRLNMDRAFVLLARTYEDAVTLISKCKKRIAGIILDAEFPAKGKLSDKSSWDFLDFFWRQEPRAPVIFQSAEEKFLKEARHDPRVLAINKNEQLMFFRVSQWIEDYFGFGDFIFRNPQGEQIGRARDLATLLAYVEKLPPEKIQELASINHFSNWLWLHGYRKASLEIRPIPADDPEFVRQKVLEICSQYL